MTSALYLIELEHEWNKELAYHQQDTFPVVVASCSITIGYHVVNELSKITIFSGEKNERGRGNKNEKGPHQGKQDKQATL